MPRPRPSASAFDRALPASALSLSATVLILWTSVWASPGKAEEVASGLQVGEWADQFLVKDCTGPAAGKTLCYYCRYGNRPVVAVFVRELNDEVADLVARIDRRVERHRADQLAAFVVLLGDDTTDAEKRLKRVAKERGIRRTPLTIYRGRPEKLAALYRLAPNAEVTALMWRRRRVTVNRAFDNAQLTSQQIDDLLEACEASLTR